jgi:hypothetical protein
MQFFYIKGFDGVVYLCIVALECLEYIIILIVVSCISDRLFDKVQENEFYRSAQLRKIKKTIGLS